VSWLVHARPVNGPFDDPGLFIDFRFGRRAILFDLGSLAALSAREILRVSHAFVSHTHMDHFGGFDALLRVCLHREAPLQLVGPPGFADRVEAKLRAYTWNLLDEASADLLITASEYDGAFLHAAAFRAREAFRRREMEPPRLPSGLLLDEEDFSIEAAVLDHGIPCLAFAFQERLRVNVIREGLAALRLPVGPWLNAAKRAVRRGEPDDASVAVPGGTMPLGALKERALRVGAGQRIVYVTDAAGHEANAERIIALARGADQLFIEAAFLEADAALADTTRHLTAARAGTLARRAGVGRVVPFHFSARYLGREGEIRRELDDAFGGSEVEPSGRVRVSSPVDQE
jgi:ribonuclease Z